MCSLLKNQQKLPKEGKWGSLQLEYSYLPSCTNFTPFVSFAHLRRTTSLLSIRDMIPDSRNLSAKPRAALFFLFYRIKGKKVAQGGNISVDFFHQIFFQLKGRREGDRSGSLQLDKLHEFDFRSAP